MPAATLVSSPGVTPGTQVLTTTDQRIRCGNCTLTRPPNPTNLTGTTCVVCGFKSG